LINSIEFFSPIARGFKLFSRGFEYYPYLRASSGFVGARTRSSWHLRFLTCVSNKKVFVIDNIFLWRS